MAAHRVIGVYDCWSCGHEVPVKETEKGRLSAVCPWCDFQHWAQPDTEHAKKLRAKMRQFEKTVGA